MRVLLVGDTHASRIAIERSFALAAKLTCDKIFQVGDFGFWPREKDGQEFLALCDQLSKDSGIPLYFLAGNHEDWGNLDIIFTTYATDEDGFHIYGNMRIAPRSHIWVWDGVTYGNMSGAFSIDRKQRRENWSWFKQEMPEMADVAQLMDLKEQMGIEHIDVMLAHDAPENLFAVVGEYHRVIKSTTGMKSQEVSMAALQQMKPTVYVHGHWHYNLQYWVETTLCLGLNMANDGTEDAYAVIDRVDDEVVLNKVYMNELQDVYNIL